MAGEIQEDLNELEKNRRENSAVASDIATKKKIMVVNGPIKQSKLTGIDEKEFLELKQLFDRLDTSGDNLVELSELEVGLNEIGYDVTGNESEQLLAKLDTSGDGVVELNEFLAALVDWESVEKSESYPSWVKRAFDLLDEDDSGLLDANASPTLSSATPTISTFPTKITNPSDETRSSSLHRRSRRRRRWSNRRRRVLRVYSKWTRARLRPVRLEVFPRRRVTTILSTRAWTRRK